VPCKQESDAYVGRTVNVVGAVKWMGTKCAFFECVCAIESVSWLLFVATSRCARTAPEQLVTPEYSRMSDVYAFGVVMFEIMAGEVCVILCARVLLTSVPLRITGAVERVDTGGDQSARVERRATRVS
jgi:hypothetical protein